MNSVRGKESNSLYNPWLLSVAGLIPFIFLSLFIFFNEELHPLYSLAVDVFKVWSAIILSFLGGIRWGAAINQTAQELDMEEGLQKAHSLQLLFSVLPSIAALLALLLPSVYCIPALMVCFCLQGAWDSFSAMSGSLPKWMGKLRATLTLLVVAAHVLVIFALA